MTPTQAYIAAAHGTRDVTDAAGRVLTIRRPTTLDRLHLFKAVGPALSMNERYLGMAMLAFAVTAIDGVPLPHPTNEHQVETAVDRLGDAGIAAIAACLAPEDTEGLATATPGN
jgi:hypothetical protein